MAIDINDPLVQIKVTSAVCSFVAICTTCYRLFVRRGRYWADDAWALFSMLVLFVQIAAVFMHVSNPQDLSKTNRVAAYYLMATSFYTIIWSARLSILFSIIRLDPSEERRRRLLGIAVLFFVVLLVLLSQLFWVCEPEHHWKDMKSPQCTLNKQVAICQLVSDVIADLILIVAPLKLLAGLEDKVLRHRLMVIFSTCIITTVVSLVHAAYILTLGGVKVVIAALVEDCVSLIVCNIPVVVTAVIHIREDSQHPKGKKGSLISTVLHFATRILTQKETDPTPSTDMYTLGDLTTGNTDTSRGLSTFEEPDYPSRGDKSGNHSHQVLVVDHDSDGESSMRHGISKSMVGAQSFV